MWKKAFVVLLSINLFCIAAGGVWLDSLPKQAASVARTPAVAGRQAAQLQVSMGDEAINSYLEYALSEQADLRQVLSYAKVHFDDQWKVELGIKFSERIIPFDVVFAPDVHAGNLDLQVRSAVMGDIPVPIGLLFLLFRHLPWPAWVAIDSNQSTIHLNFSERPQRPYGVTVVGYNTKTRALTLLVSIVPKAVFKPA